MLHIINANRKASLIVAASLLVVAMFRPSITRMALVLLGVAVAALAHFLSKHTDAFLQKPLTRVSKGALIASGVVLVFS